MNPFIFNLFASKAPKENIHWSKRLYLGQEIGPKFKAVKKNIRKEKFTKDIYILMMPLGEANQLDIMDASYLKQPYYRKKPLYIVGIAQGKGEANEILLRIAKDCYAKQGNGDIRTFLRERLREEGTMIE